MALKIENLTGGYSGINVIKNVNAEGHDYSKWR